MWKQIVTIIALLVSVIGIAAQTGSPMKPAANLPSGYWPLEKSAPVIDKTQTIRLSPDVSHLTEGERKAVAKLLEVGQIFQSLYEKQRHPEAASSYRQLVQLDKRSGSAAATQNLLTLYRLNQGPIATTLENKREPFLPVDEIVPGKNMYPWGVTKEQLESFLAAHPDKRREILDPRSVVRTANSLNADADLAKLRKYPVLDTLHPGLRAKLEAISHGGARPSGALRVQGFYAVPYSVFYADQLTKAYAL